MVTIDSDEKFKKYLEKKQKGKRKLCQGICKLQYKENQDTDRRLAYESAYMAKFLTTKDIRLKLNYTAQQVKEINDAYKALAEARRKRTGNKDIKAATFNPLIQVKRNPKPLKYESQYGYCKNCKANIEFIPGKLPRIFKETDECGRHEKYVIEGTEDAMRYDIDWIELEYDPDYRNQREEGRIDPVKVYQRNLEIEDKISNNNPIFEVDNDGKKLNTSLEVQLGLMYLAEFKKQEKKIIQNKNQKTLLNRNRRRYYCPCCNFKIRTRSTASKNKKKKMGIIKDN